MTKREQKIRYCTVSEAADRLKVTRQTVYRWITSGKIKTEKIGREIVINRIELHKVIRNLWMDSLRKEISNGIINDFFFEGEFIKGYQVKSAEASKNFGFIIKLEEPFVFSVTWPNGKRERVTFPMDAIHVKKDGHIAWYFPKDFPETHKREESNK